MFSTHIITIEDYNYFYFAIIELSPNYNISYLDVKYDFSNGSNNFSLFLIIIPIIIIIFAIIVIFIVKCKRSKIKDSNDSSADKP